MPKWPWWIVVGTLVVGLLHIRACVRRASCAVHCRSRTIGGFLLGMAGVLLLLVSGVGVLVIALIAPPALAGAADFTHAPAAAAIAGVGLIAYVLMGSSQ